MAITAMMSLGSGLLGAYNAYKGNKREGNAISGMTQNDGQMRGAFSGTEDLIGRMTNFNQYSGGAMDLASQQGNKGVEDAMMMGMGGSQSNAIKNRMKRSGMNQAYQSMQSGLGNAAQLQGGIDGQISTQMTNQFNAQKQAQMGQAQRQMQRGSDMMGPKGAMGLIGSIGSLFG